MTKLIKSVLVMAVATLPFAAMAGTKMATCEIYAGGESYRGACVFESQKGGSFSVSKPKGAILTDISTINVAILEKDVAQVRGLTADGINSMWGEAVRSQTDRACWVGEEFKICAR